MIQIGGCSLLGLGLPQLLRARSIGSPLKASADVCILIFLNGGPSHLDMWDMKPAAPEAIRGEFKPIDSSLPGVPVCEHLPQFARWVHKGSIVRSAHHGVNNSHAAAVYCSLTGHDRGELGGGAKATDNPAIGSVVGLCRPPEGAMLPYVSLPYITAEGAGGPPQPGFFGGWLGKSRDPLFVLKDPSDARFAMPELSPPSSISTDRFYSRRELKNLLASAPEGLGGDQRIRDLDQFQERAFQILTSSSAQAAFQIDREDPRTRDRYGRNIYGQSVLLGAGS